MQELLFGTWWASFGSPAFAWGCQHPWTVFAAVLVAVLAWDLMFGKRRSRGDASGLDFDFGDGDGGEYGD